ncbi:MAG TPA: succinate dehydrogenase assembly factor 2 [Acetobacteraceae bacterium]|nr:succinate dehydrogenase assembly factor 2 [Acetobacteraceae bacterium]
MEQTPPSADAAALDPRRRRVLYRATHRGTRENDLLIGGYVARRIAGMEAAELDALEALMELPDAALADWLTGRQPIPAGPYAGLLAAIRAAALA